jgi:hypothetical protein
MKLKETTAKGAKRKRQTLHYRAQIQGYLTRINQAISPANSGNMQKTNYKDIQRPWDVLISLYEDGDEVT